MSHWIVGRRFIPVYTGNTLSNDWIIWGGTVYPCVYREHVFIFIPMPLLPGLSLCIQGTLITASRSNRFQRFIPVYTGNTLIITYCLLNKIGACKILPAFCCFFRRFVSRRILNLIWSLSNSYIYLKRFFNGAHFYNFSAHRPILLTTSNITFWCLILTNYSILILQLRLCFIQHDLACYNH